MTPLEARIAECDRLESGQRAEGQGLRAAAVFDALFRFSSDRYRQHRFEEGFREGKLLLEVAHATPDDCASETAAGGLRDGECDDPDVRGASA